MSSAPGGASNNGQASAAPPSGGQGEASASSLLWTKTQHLPEEAFRQLHSIYGDHFPLEARHHLAGMRLVLLIFGTFRQLHVHHCYDFGRFFIHLCLKTFVHFLSDLFWCNMYIGLIACGPF